CRADRVAADEALPDPPVEGRVQPVDERADTGRLPVRELLEVIGDLERLEARDLRLPTDEPLEPGELSASRLAVVALRRQGGDEGGEQVAELHVLWPALPHEPVPLVLHVACALLSRPPPRARTL